MAKFYIQSKNICIENAMFGTKSRFFPVKVEHDLGNLFDRDFIEGYFRFFYLRMV